MFDTIENDQFPTGAAAYAGYVDGSIGNQPNYAFIVSAFPKAEHLSIALFSSDNADALDVESGASVPADVPAWWTRQRARGITRPVVYASASAMNDDILPVLSGAKIARTTVRLWTAHYGAGEHICGPGTCGLLSENADGTQWTPTAGGLVLDQSLLLEDFFTTPTTTPPVTTEAELQSGLLNTGKNALTVIAVPPGTAHHVAFGCDNSIQGLAPAKLRVAIHDTTWHITNGVTVEGTAGLKIIAFPTPAKTGVISVVRSDAGTAQIGYVVY
jgi:hypothetical protein